MLEISDVCARIPLLKPVVDCKVFFSSKATVEMSVTDDTLYSHRVVKILSHGKQDVHSTKIALLTFLHVHT
jgi:hypothetical protein